jgi:hypothetical protein
VEEKICRALRSGDAMIHVTVKTHVM